MSAFRLVSTPPYGQPHDGDGGHTILIANGPNAATWHWRLSVTQLERDSDFSALADTRCQLVTLDAPLQLRFTDGREHTLPRLRVIHLDGVDAPQASLLEGATRVFHLALRDFEQGELIARPLNGAMWLPLRSGSRWFVHLLNGQASVLAQPNQSTHESFEMAPSQSLWIDAQPGQRVRIDGGGELLLVQLAD